MASELNEPISAVISAVNLVSGGAVQVASSVITEMTVGQAADAFPWLGQAVFLASPQVAETLGAEVMADPRVRVMSAGQFSRRPEFDLAPDAVWFDVFGGSFQRRVPVPRLAGFADGTSIYPHPTATGLERLRIGIRSLASRASFRRADRIVVESDAVKERLVLRGYRRDSIDVVRNSYHPVFDEPVAAGDVEAWRTKLTAEAEGRPTLLYVARYYPHKNHAFIGAVGRAYAAEGRTPPAFVVTLTDDEFAQLDESTRDVCVNIGPVTVPELPALYQAVDGCFFPSLLEIFSATPLEAVRSACPLVAVDRDYVTAVVGARAAYFTPGDPQSARESIDRALATPAEDLAAYADWAAGLDGSAQRALAYAQILDDMRRTGQAVEA